MSPVANHGSLICCAGREPPSPDPDERSPRPSVSPTKSLKRPPQDVSKVQFSSLGSIEETHQQSLHLVGDKDDTHRSDHELAPLPSKAPEDIEQEVRNTAGNVKARMSFGNLNLKEVTRNLKKHLSRESAVNKKHSRSSIGQSEEEVERRAELRRIRQKRIEEELSYEDEPDDDAESLFAVVDASPDDSMDISKSPGTPLSPRSSKLSQISLPILSPFVRKSKIATHVEQSGLLEALSTRVADINNFKRDSVGSIPRRYSSPILANFELSFADPRVYVPSRKSSIIPTMPSTPNLKPRRLSSIAEPNKSSWRLSFASPNRGEQLRRLSMEHAAPLSTISSLLDAHVVPTRRWLHDQGLRSSSHGFETNKCSNLKVSHLLNHTEDFGGVDGSIDSGNIFTQYQINSSGNSTTEQAEPLYSPTGSHTGPEMSEPEMSDSSNSIAVHRARPKQNTSNPLPLSERLPPSLGRIRDEDMRSQTLTTFPTTQHSPKTSRFSIISLISRRSGISKSKETLNLLSMPRASTNTASLTIDDPVGSLTAPSTSHARRSTNDDGSILASETESFREREAELKVVQARFASNDAPRSPSTPRSSKFREEFEFTTYSTAFAEPGERKLSAFARLTRFATRTFDGANAVEDLLAVPMPKFKVLEGQGRTPGWGRNPGRTPALVSPLADTEASIQWGRAIKLTADSRTKEVSNHLHLPTKRGSVSRKKSSFGGWKKGDKGKEREEEPMSAAAQYDKQFQERLAVKEMVMDDWEAEMEATAQKAKAKSRNIVSKIKPSGPDRRFPLSWSRFPSHDRSERSLSAGAPDRVAQHDFAMRVSGSGERIFHQCREVEDDRHIHDDDPDWHKYDPEEMPLAEQIKDKISQTIYHLEVHGGGSKPFEFQTDGRRGSMVLADKLEFPELELLAVSPGLPLEVPERKDPFTIQAAKDKEMKRQIVDKFSKFGKQFGSVDGNVDELDLENSNISIADPRFYTDCLVLPSDERTSTPFSSDTEDSEPLASIDRSRSKTWNGRGSNSRNLGRGRNLSVGNMALRASTDDYLDEMAKREKAELDKLLRSASLPVHN